MLFLNPRRVADRLRVDAFSEALRYRFIVAALLLQGGDALVRGVFFIGPTRPSQRLITSFFTLVLSLVGVHFAHRTNERGDNRAFIERWLCLSVPLTFWTRNVPYLLQVGLYYTPFGALLRRFSSLFSASHWLLLILFYVAVTYYMRVVSDERSIQNVVGPPLAAP